MKNKNPKVIFCTVASNDYMILLERLLASAELYAPGNLIYSVLVNVSKDRVENLKKIYPGFIAEHDYVKFNNLNQQKGYCSNRRARLFSKIMKLYDCPVIWIDADSIFIKSADEIINYSYEYDLSADFSENHPTLSKGPINLKQYPLGPHGTPYYGVFNISIMTTNNSTFAKEFFYQYEELVEMHNTKWYSDQEGLYILYDRLKSKISFNSLPIHYCSRENNENSIIWTLKADLKKNEDYILKGNQFLFDVLGWESNNIVENESNINLISQEFKNPNYFNKIFRKIKDILKIIIR